MKEEKRALKGFEGEECEENRWKAGQAERGQSEGEEDSEKVWQTIKCHKMK